MDQIRAHVRNGRLIVDQETDLPEGMVIELVIVDEGDDLGVEERARLHRALESAWESTERGLGHEAGDVLRDLRQRR